MQWLTLVPEDAAIQRLQAARAASAATGELDAVARYPSVHPARIGDARSGTAVPRRERRRGERRKAERREQQAPAAFDTRSKHDRRQCQDRRCRDEAGTAAAMTGVDVFA